MPVYELEGVAPRIDTGAFVHPDAVVIGNVAIGAESSIWPGAVLRGDYGTITVGAGSSLQDGTVVHAGPGFPTVIGDGCVIGHLAHLEGCTVQDESLVGSGATVGANAVVPNHMVVPPGALALGVPAKVFEDRSDVATIRVSAAEYVRNAKRYQNSLRRVG
jgi:carbonic anhydrase/acetyltransferase-like protein (isoleucine patch superfamily)